MTTAITITIHNYKEHLSELTFADYCNLISISKGNRKTGAIRSLSFPPVITCNKNLHCYKACYAAKMKNYAPGTVDAWQRNLDLYLNDRWLFAKAVVYLTKIDKAFRFFVGGDCPDYAFTNMIHLVAVENPGTEYLVFSKQYSYWNNYYANTVGNIPKNLHINISVDFGQQEPHMFDNAFPLIHVVESLENIPDDWKVCGGNCFDCICRNTGCWTLKAGDRLAILKH